MADNPILKVCIDNATPVKSLTIINAQRLDITYIIDANNNSEFYLVIPMFSESGDNKYDSLFYIEDGNKFEAPYLSLGQVVNAKDNHGKFICGVYKFTDVKGEFIFKLSGNVDISKFTALDFRTGLGSKPIGTALSLCCSLTMKQPSNPDDLQVVDKVTITVSEDTKKPTITKFTSDHLFVDTNGNIKLFWDVDPDSSAISFTRDDGKSVMSSNGFVTGFTDETSLSQTTTYTLTATNSNASSTATLEVTVPVLNQCIPLSTTFDNQSIMGLYNLDDKLYALTQIGDTINMWESLDGSSWIATIGPNNQIQEFAYYPPAGGDKVMIPPQFAGSPGVVFNRQLFLIGGSRFDTKFVHNDVYVYDFYGRYWQLLQVPDDTKPPAHMGAACVVFNNQIWLIGGVVNGLSTNQVMTLSIDGGTATWSDANSQPPQLPYARGMASAIVYTTAPGVEEIQIFGGFSVIPGAADVNLQGTLGYDGSKWSPPYFQTTKPCFTNCQAVVFSKNVLDTQGNINTESTRILFMQYYDNDQTLNDKIAPVLEQTTDSSVLGTLVAGFGLMSSWFNLQTIAFRGAIWFFCLTQDSDDVNQLYYFVPNY